MMVDTVEHRNAYQKAIETSSALLIRTAQADARKSVSKWCWVILGTCLSCLPYINVLALVLAIVAIGYSIPKINLSTPERTRIYSQYPALYTVQYRRTARKLRLMCMLWGWIAGIFFINPF